jgi:hypothetical protein
MSELHRVVSRYAHDGKLIDLLGGLRAAIARVDALLARYAPAEPEDPTAGSLALRAPPTPAGSREWTDAVLGAIAIRDHLAQALRAAAATTPDAQPVRPGPVQESLLR